MLRLIFYEKDNDTNFLTTCLSYASGKDLPLGLGFGVGDKSSRTRWDGSRLVCSANCSINRSFFFYDDGLCKISDLNELIVLACKSGVFCFALGVLVMEGRPLWCFGPLGSNIREQRLWEIQNITCMSNLALVSLTSLRSHLQQIHIK